MLTSSSSSAGGTLGGVRWLLPYDDVALGRANDGEQLLLLAKYGHVASTTPPFNAPPSSAEPHRKWGLLALYIAPNPHLTPPYLPFLGPKGGGYAGFVRRKEGAWTPIATRLQHVTVDR